MKRLHTYAATAAMAATLVACGSDLEHGTITGKVYLPVRHSIYEQPIYTTYCHFNGKTTACTQTLTGFIPIPETYPACWRLDLRDGKKTGHVCVSEEAWNKAKTGEHW